MLVISSHSLNGSGTSNVSFIFFSRPAAIQGHITMGANGVAFNAFDVHSLMLIKLKLRTRRQPHLGYSQVTVRDEQLASYSIFISEPTH